MTNREKTLVSKLLVEILDKITTLTPKVLKESKPKYYKDRKIMRRLRIVKGLSDREIAERLGCSIPTVNTWRHHFGMHKSLASRKW